MPKKKLTPAQRSDYITAYLMIAPLVLGLGVFYLYPTFKVFIDSFYDVGAFNKREWAGISNYVTMFTDPNMWLALRNTFVYVLVIVPGTVVFSLFVACLLNTDIKGKALFRVLYFLPAVTMGAAVAMMWRWMFNADYGIINSFLGNIGIKQINFLSNPRLAIFTVCIVGIWINVGYDMIILLAGIQGIPKTYYEASTIDGAKGLQQFFYITLPLVTPTLFFVIITTLISTFQTFDIIYMMIAKNSIVKEQTQSMVVYFYTNAFELSKKGYASAIAIFLFCIIMLITLLQLWFQKKWVNYD